jgi:hypothetical protein
MADVTLDAVAAGDRHAAAQLLPLIYDELRQLAAVRMASEAADHTLQPRMVKKSERQSASKKVGLVARSGRNFGRERFAKRPLAPEC